MKFIFFGPPGSGKGTQANLLVSSLNIPHLSTGDIFRSKLKEQDSLSDSLRQIISSGNLVSDEITNKIVSEKLLSSDCKSGFILDGYPRTLSQSNFLISFFENNNIDLDLIVYFKLDKKDVENRIISRSKIEKRSDDNIDIIKTRIKKYNEETAPLVEIYRQKFPQIFIEINAAQDISKIQDEIKNKLKNAIF